MRKAWKPLCACVVAGACCAAAWTLVATPVYTATAPLYVVVSLADNHDPEALVNSALYARQAVASYVEAATSPTVLAASAESLGLEGDSRALAGKVTATSPDDTAVLNITATDPDPQRAADRPEVSRVDRCLGAVLEV
jgi:capsular polysaccharide biosynthesis protein